MQERLWHQRRHGVEVLYAHVGVAPEWDGDLDDRLHHVGDRIGSVDSRLRSRIHDLVGTDVDRMRELLGDDIPEWQAHR